MRWIDPLNWPWQVNAFLGIALIGTVARDIEKAAWAWAAFDGLLMASSFVIARRKYKRHHPGGRA